jgi:amino acid transporter
VRESGRIFALPTYLFITAFGALIAWGFLRILQGRVEPLAESTPEPTAGLTAFLVLRAFSSGCTALTGIEAISNGVPAFREPESRNAAITLRWMAAILGTLFLGITVLAWRFGVVPIEGETVVSQLARGLAGRGIFYYLVQASTALILVLAANTAFADFPRLASLLARDGYVPRQLATRGDRLVFSNGIVMLAMRSSSSPSSAGRRTPSSRCTRWGCSSPLPSPNSGWPGTGSSAESAAGSTASW